MSGIVELMSRPETLTVTNIVLAVCIVFHLCCEFAHYIHEFWSHRKDGRQVKANGEMLIDMMSRIEKIEKTQKTRGAQQCPLKKNMEEKNYVDDKVYVKTDRTL